MIFTVIYDLKGSKSIVRVLCFITKYFKTSLIILLGNTASPTIIEWLKSKCELNILGIIGEYDTVAVATALSRINGLVECKYVKYNGVAFLGLGLSGCQEANTERVDLFLSSKPGLYYTCCHSCSDRVDSVVKRVNPRLLITGSCRKPCYDPSKRVFSPGSVRLGYIGLVELSERGELHIRSLNIEKTTIELNHYLN